jgi:hypothetical protein
MATMDVQFRNPFYHSQLGLLGGAGDEDTVYILPDTQVLPRSAVVVEGVSQDRKNNEGQAAAAARAARLAPEPDEEELEDAGPAKRVRPKEGAAKGDNIPKKRKR